MQKYVLMLTLLCTFFACKEANTDLDELEPMYYMSKIEYKFLSCDTVEIPGLTSSYVNNAPGTLHYSHTDSTIKYREFRFIADQLLPQNMLPESLPVEVNIPVMDTGDNFSFTKKEYPYQEDFNYLEDGLSVVTHTGDLTPYSKISFSRINYIEKCTFSYILTLIDTNLGIEKEITGTWEQEKLYFSKGRVVFEDIPND